MVLLGSGITIEQTPPPPRMDDVRRELDAAVLQAKKHYIRRARERHTEEDVPVKRYMYAVTVMRNDRYFSLHSGRRSRSLTRVYVEEREQRSKSTVPALPRKNGFVEEETEDGSLRLEWHETIEGRKADVVEDDVTVTTELTQILPYEYREWEHEVVVQEPSESTTVWRVGDHLFSYEEPFDLSVKLPDQVHYFFTGEHLPEKRRLYTSLPNLSTVGVESAAFDHSAHSFYGHGFRQVGTTFLSRTMESLNDDRVNIGARPAIHEVIQEKNDTIERMEHTSTHNVQSSYTSASTVEVGSGVQDTTYHAVPVHVTENEQVYATSSDADLYTDRSVHQTEEVLQKATEISDLYNPYYQQASTVSADYYAEPPSPENNNQNESMVVEPPSPELQRSAEKFAAEFTEKLAKVEDVLREADIFIKTQHSQEKIYDNVYEERIYDEVPAQRYHSVAPPVPVSPIPKPREELHYASVAIATEDNRYKDDEHIYEEIGDAHVVETSPYATADINKDSHVVESSAYADTNLYNAYETPSSLIQTKEEPIYSDVPKEDVFTKVVHKVEHSISHLKQKFESHSEESHYKIEAPKRKDFTYDENSNTQIEDQQLIRTPEATETTSARVVYREVKPYVGSPTFNKLQKKFFPEDLAERQAQREREEIDISVLNSPTTVVTNNGVTETEYRAYDKNQYEDSTATLVMKSPVDAETARTTLAIRRMSRNNQWSEDEGESPRLTTTYFDYNETASPAKISPLPSPRAGSISPRYDRSPSSPRPESPKIENRVTPPVRPTELHISVEHHRKASPVDRVVSTEEKAPHSPEILYQSGFVNEKRKLFENGGVQSQQSYAPVVKLRTTATRTTSTVVKTAEVQPPAKVHQAVSSPPEVELKRVTVGQIGVTAPKQQEEGTKRKSVLEMRREYEASMQQSQVSSTTSSPHRSRANSRRRTGEIEIGTGASLSKYSEEQSSAARRTVHRTLEKHMKEETASVPVGHGVQVSIERRVEPTVSTSVIGHGAAVKEAKITVASSSSSSSVTIGSGSAPSRITSAVSPSSSIGYGAVPTSVPPPLPEQAVPVQPQVTVEFPLEVAQPVKEATQRESSAVVEEEPTPLQRNGSGRRSWTVKTYENNIRFDNQKLKMPDVDYVTSNGHITNGVEKMNGEENASLKDWDPRPLVGALYEVSYNPRLETKRNRFVNMEGHVDVPSDETNTLAELEREWKQQYMRTKEGRLQVFVSHCAEEAPAEDIVLSGCEVDANRDERTLTIHGGRDHIKMLLRVPSSVFDKWRQALLSHAASSQIDAYVKPVHRTMEHLTERVIIIEIGSCSIRGGRLTQETSLPQSFFPAIAIRTDDGKIVVGEDAYAPEVRHRGEFVRPIQASDPAVERYTMDKDVVKACMSKVVSDLQIDPSKYKVLLSIPQNIPIVLISELVTIALQDIKFQGAAITRQPSLILYAYDVTTGVVVDIGDRLNIVPVIDGYVVDSAICSIPYGATQVREALRSDLCANNKGLYSFQSPIEKLILRYVMEQSSYVPEDYGKEEKSGVKDVMVTLEPFNPTPGMQTKFNIDSSRFTCTEGLFRPKKWGLDTKGLHQLVHEAVQMSPIDSRRTLYRNIYLAGGASLLPGLAEKLEQELANIVPNTIHTQVHISPWRYNAAYLGAQVVASSSTFEDKCVTAENLQKFLFNLSTSTF